MIQQLTMNQQFIEACKNGNVELVKELIKNGVNIDENDRCSGYVPLTVAISNNHENVFKELIENGACINHKDIFTDYAPLITAVMCNSQLAKELILMGATVDICDSEGESALMIASGAGDLNIVELLLQYNANVNFQNRHDYSILHRVASSIEYELSNIENLHKNKLEILKKLIIAGANTNLKANNKLFTEMLSDEDRIEMEQFCSSVVKKQ